MTLREKNARRRGGRSGPGPAVTLLVLGTLVGLLLPGPVPFGPVHPRGAPASSMGSVGPSSAPPSVPWLGPHPNPAPAARSAFMGHYYAGAVYSGTNTTATALSADIGVPADAPQSTDFYYVVLSAWDSAGSYDQVGVTNDYGVWGLSYSTTSACAGSYYYSTDAYNLSAGTTYRFAMTFSGGSLVFTATPVGGSLIWRYSTNTGGSWFDLSALYSCGSSNSLDYTAYEEVYQTSAPVPPYDFALTNESSSAGPVGSWTAFTSSAPQGISVSISSADAEILNEPFAASIPSPLDAELSASSQTLRTNVTVEALGSATSVTLSVAGPIPNATVALAVLSGTTPLTSGLTVTIGSTTPPGRYPLEVEVTENSGSYSRTEVVVDLVDGLSAAVPSATPPSVDANQSVSFLEVPLGGVGPYRYLWSGLPSNCTAMAADVVCTPPRAGTFSVAVEVTDSLGYVSDSSPIELTVAPALEVRGWASAASVDAGQTVEFQVNATGGGGGTSVHWTVTPVTNCSVVGAVMSCTPATAGALKVGARVTDANGNRIDLSTMTVTVDPDPSVQITAAPSEVDVGGIVRFTLNATGGSGGYAWRLIDLPGPCSAAGASSVACRTNRSDLFPVVAVLNDSNGFAVVSPTVNVSVYPDPTLALNASRTDLLQGEGLAIVAVPGDGRAPYALTWSGLPEGCSTTSASLSCRPSGVGTFVVVVRLVDAAGGNASASTTVRVAPSFLGLPEAEGWEVTFAAMAAAAAVTAASVGLVVRRRRRSRRRPMAARPPTARTAGSRSTGERRPTGPPRRPGGASPKR